MTKYDIVGSFLRPEELKKAREEYENDEISIDQLHEVEDKCIKDLVQKEQEAGLKIVTDGEFRRSWWHLDTFWGFDGIKHTHQNEGYIFHDEETRNDSAQVSGKIKFSGDHPDLEAFKYLKSLTDGTDLTPRQSIPAPAQLYAELIRGQENVDALKKYYSSEDELIHDVASAYHDLILALYEAGARDIKIDDCTWGMITDQNFAKGLVTDESPTVEDLKEKYLKANNEALKDLPDDLRISTHICRGNYHSTWAAQGGYGAVADYLFAQENVDAFYLEFDDERSGGFEPLAKVPEDREVILGLVTSKNPKLEDPAELKARIKEASKYHDFDHLGLSTQCGFASTEEGNQLTEEEQWKKIKLVVSTAKDVFED